MRQHCRIESKHSRAGYDTFCLCVCMWQYYLAARNSNISLLKKSQLPIPLQWIDNAVRQVAGFLLNTLILVGQIKPVYHKITHYSLTENASCVCGDVILYLNLLFIHSVHSFFTCSFIHICFLLVLFYTFEFIRNDKFYDIHFDFSYQFREQRFNIKPFIYMLQ